VLYLTADKADMFNNNYMVTDYEKFNTSEKLLRNQNQNIS